jgi:hypothetical protein
MTSPRAVLPTRALHFFTAEDAEERRGKIKTFSGQPVDLLRLARRNQELSCLCGHLFVTFGLLPNLSDIFCAVKFLPAFRAKPKRRAWHNDLFAVPIICNRAGRAPDFFGPTGRTPFQNDFHFVPPSSAGMSRFDEIKR